MFLPKKVTVKAPPIKIQGIKTKLVPFIAESVAWDGSGRWVEPFLGSAAVVMNIVPKRALLADTNEHIIRFYSYLQEGKITSRIVKEFLADEGDKLLKVGEEHYYFIRKRFNEEKNPLDLIFLNRACFNGVMRFNKKGGFNVPFCRKPERFRQALVTKVSNQVSVAEKIMRGKEWEFKCQDWRKTLSEARVNDFVYLDPPYIGRHTDYFNQWSENEAVALANSMKGLLCGFAYSMWKENKYRENGHLADHFADYPTKTYSHFYHIGSSESLRNEMEEALVISPNHVAEIEDDGDQILRVPVKCEQAVLPL